MHNQPRVMITGSTGFVGSALSMELNAQGHYIVIQAARKAVGPLHSHRKHELMDIGCIPSMQDIDIVVHTAARVHVMVEYAEDSLQAFRAANVAGTLHLANAAAASGVKRFVYVSSVKVNGEQTFDRPFSVFDQPAPQDSYGISKLEAEQGLREIGLSTGMEIVIVRPPLVYGPGVKANFQIMMKWVQRGIPLPFGTIGNARSLVSISNLIDLLILCIAHPKAAGQTFLVSDGEDLSTTELLTRIAQALGRKPILLPVPISMLKLAGAITGKNQVIQRLCGSLQVDIGHTRDCLDWSPRISVDQGLRDTAIAFCHQS